jgi:hypothetical protein
MQVTYYKTDKGIVVRDQESIRLKSCYTKTILTEDEFNGSNPVKISKAKYAEELNTFFRNDKFEWTHEGTKFRKMENFEMGQWSVTNYNFPKDIPMHDIGKSYLGKCFIVVYHGRLYYTFLSGNYFPQMQLVDFHTKDLVGKWTNIKNLAPIMNKTTKKII